MQHQFFPNEISGKFYLSKPKSKKPTSILFIVNLNKKQIKFHLGVKVYPKHWSKEAQRVYTSKIIPFLDNLNNEIANNRIIDIFNRFILFKEYICNIDNEVLETVKGLVDDGINLYMQKEKFTLFDDNKQPSMFAPIMLATLSTCAQLERENIKFRLNSGRQQYIAKGGQLGRKVGSIKSTDKKKEEYKDVLKALRQGYSVRKVAKLTDTSASTVQRLKKEFHL